MSHDPSPPFDAMVGAFARECRRCGEPVEAELDGSMAAVPARFEAGFCERCMRLVERQRASQARSAGLGP